MIMSLPIEIEFPDPRIPTQPVQNHKKVSGHAIPKAGRPLLLVG
jgi:hypothetical protein